jgi:hypothetical protein
MKTKTKTRNIKQKISRIIESKNQKTKKEGKKSRKI